MKKRVDIRWVVVPVLIVVAGIAVGLSLYESNASRPFREHSAEFRRIAHAIIDSWPKTIDTESVSLDRLLREYECLRMFSHTFPGFGGKHLPYGDIATKLVVALTFPNGGADNYSELIASSMANCDDAMKRASECDEEQIKERLIQESSMWRKKADDYRNEASADFSRAKMAIDAATTLLERLENSL